MARRLRANSKNAVFSNSFRRCSLKLRTLLIGKSEGELQGAYPVVYPVENKKYHQYRPLDVKIGRFFNASKYMGSRNTIFGCNGFT